MSRPDFGVQMSQQLARKDVALDRAWRECALDRGLVQEAFADEHAVEGDFAQPIEVAPNDLVVEIAGPVLPQAIEDRLRNLAAECPARESAILPAGEEHVGRNSQRQLHKRLRV